MNQGADTSRQSSALLPTHKHHSQPYSFGANCVSGKHSSSVRFDISPSIALMNFRDTYEMLKLESSCQIPLMWCWENSWNPGYGHIAPGLPRWSKISHLEGEAMMKCSFLGSSAITLSCFSGFSHYSSIPLSSSWVSVLARKHHYL